MQSGDLQLSSNHATGPSKARDGARYRLSNLLSELDMPGEWFVDQPWGQLLYWPVDEGNTTVLTASILDTVISAYDVENLVFSGIRIESARSIAVHLFRGVGHQIVNCDVSCSGSSAICGVGTTIRKNHVHSDPDSAICLFGNEHLVEQNQIHHVCREADDSAAVHLSHDPTYRGNVIRKNHIHDLGGFSKSGVFGIYLDDFASGTMVSDNFLSNTIRGVAIGGGRDNIIENNVIVGSLASIQLDARGKTWAKHHIDGEHSRIHQLCRRTLAESPIYAQRHSELANMLDDELASPKGNSIRMNSFDSRIGIDLQGVDTSLVAMTGNARRPSADLACISSSGSRRGAQVVNFQQRFEPACGIIPGTTYGPS